jgi:hypothetical protein
LQSNILHESFFLNCKAQMHLAVVLNESFFLNCKAHMHLALPESRIRVISISFGCSSVSMYMRRVQFCNLRFCLSRFSWIVRFRCIWLSLSLELGLFLFHLTVVLQNFYEFKYMRRVLILQSNILHESFFLNCKAHMHLALPESRSGIISISFSYSSAEFSMILSIWGKFNFAI